MYVVTVTFQIRPQHTEAFARRVRQQAADSLDNERECHLFDVCRDPGDSGRFFLYELYTDADAFQAHLASDHFVAFDSEVGDWVTDKQVSIYSRI